MTERRIKVLHIVGALNLGGAETMIMNIFRNIDRTRFQFDFYLSGNTGGFYEEEAMELGGRIINVGRRKKHPFRYCIELFRLIRREKYDVIQIHATDAQDGLPAVVAKFAGSKRICLFSHCTSGQGKLRQILMRKLFMWAVTDPQACSDLAAQWMFGSNSFKSEIIPLPIDCELCKFDATFRGTERKRLNLDEFIVIGHIGRFFPQKNHLHLLKIFSEVVKVDNRFRLVLVGDGYLKDEIDKEIQRSNLGGFVIQLGQLSGAAKELSMFDMLLLPSLYEGFPTVVLEAQANGLPCLVSSTVTRSIAITDLVKFVELNKIDEWARQIRNIQPIRNNSELYNREISQHYDIKNVTKIFANIYSS